MIRLFSKKKTPLSAEGQAYLERSGKPQPEATPVHLADFVVLDSETTGLHVGRDRMLSIATLPVTTDAIRPAQMKSWLFYQEEATVNEAVKIHGILPSETREGDDERAIVAQLLENLAGKILVGHHVRFDAKMLNEAFNRHFGVKCQNRLIDTATFASEELEAFHRTGYANQRPPSLDDICRHLDLSMADRHTATGDTYITAEVFIYLCARRTARLQRALTLGDLPLIKL